MKIFWSPLAAERLEDIYISVDNKVAEKNILTIINFEHLIPY